MAKEFRTRQVVTISTAHLVHDVYSSMLAPLLPLLIEKLGLSLSMAALLDIARRVPGLMNPLVGLMADRVCVKYLVITAPAVTAIAMSMLGTAPSFAVLFLLLLLSGLSAVVFHVPAPVLVKHFSGRQSGRGMSYYMFGGEMARTLGPLLITAALSLWGLEKSYRVMPLGLIASLLLYLRLRNLQPIAPSAGGTFAGKEWNSVRAVLPLFTAISGFLLFRMAIKTALTLYLPTYLTGKGETLWMAGAALSVLQFSGAVGTLGAGHIADRFGHRRALLVIALTTPPSALALTLLHGPVTVPLLIITGFLIFASGPIVLAVVQDTNTTSPAFVNSIFMMLTLIIGAAGALFVGFLGDRAGLETTFQICAGLSCLAIPFALLMWAKTKEKR